MLSALLILSLLSTGASAQQTDPYRVILEKRGLDEPALKSLGFILENKTARHLNETQPLTPEQLDERLAALEKKQIAVPPPPRLIPPLVPSLNAVLASFDTRQVEAVAAPAVVVALAVPPAPPGPYQERPFDASWEKIEKSFKHPKTRPDAVKALKQRFKKDPATPTGLSDDAPEALRLLAREIHEGRGGPAAAVELKRQLTLAANLTNEQKFAFAPKLTSPITVFVALARSRSTHSLDSRLYFVQMIKQLEGEGRSLSTFLREQDPNALRSADFLLRAHSYDALIPYLERLPSEAGAIAPLLFTNKNDVRSRADALQGLLLQLSLRGKANGPAAEFTRSLIAHALLSPPALASRVAVFLKLNEAILPRSVRPSLTALDPLIPSGVLEDAGLVPPQPRASWPTDRWTFNLHFASTDAYAAWRGRFLARGYVPALVAGEPALTKDFNGLRVMLVAFVYDGDDDDFLRGAEAQRFLANVTKDLRSPFVQGVILRTHAQFRISNLFDKKVTPNKMFMDGACRSAWDLRELRKRCPSCQYIVNTGTGRGKLNNDTVIAVVEGLANDLDWPEIGEEFRKKSPSTSARIQGPWTPPFAEALRVLEERERADVAAATKTSPLTN